MYTSVSLSNAVLSNELLAFPHLSLFIFTLPVTVGSLFSTCTTSICYDRGVMIIHRTGAKRVCLFTRLYSALRG